MVAPAAAAPPPPLVLANEGTGEAVPRLVLLSGLTEVVGRACEKQQNLTTYAHIMSYHGVYFKGSKRSRWYRLVFWPLKKKFKEHKLKTQEQNSKLKNKTQNSRTKLKNKTQIFGI